MACDIIKIVNPSQVIQIDSKDRKLNFPQKLEPGYVFSQNTEAFSGLPEYLDFNLYVIPSGSESGTAIKSRYQYMFYLYLGSFLHSLNEIFFHRIEQWPIFTQSPKYK